MHRSVIGGARELIFGQDFRVTQAQRVLWLTDRASTERDCSAAQSTSAKDLGLPNASR